MWETLTRYGPVLLEGTWITIALTLLSMAIAMLLGLAIATARASSLRLARAVARAYIDFFRGTPLLLQVFYLYYVLPEIGVELSAFTAGVLGLSLNYAGYLAEVYRATIQAVDPGQREAAAALGMDRATAFRRIVLPQALRIAIPPLGNYLIQMFKDTALVSTITVQELLFRTQATANTTYDYLNLYTIAFLLYFAISYPASLLVSYLERRLAHHAPQDRGTDDLASGPVELGSRRT